MYEFESGPEIPDAVLLDWIKRMFPFKIWCLESNLGGGKTHLVRQFGRLLGFEKEVSSPTFSIINQYECINTSFGLNQIYHADLYRLNTLNEVHDAGVIDYLYQDAYFIIEWPELILPLLNEMPYAWIKIDTLSNDLRKYTLKLKT
ncbi:MAG: tRNA (adenosine(37)-N6)-threonylcarbamoyltransferase complex ATPase subunit type 1 TsaE [Saprospiraceae bacterium]|nr:tRNA (adenosine(37)-N6)-threonylcarbamoyltransferase complex ATPase subunit type 1 TsaE [Saprospiraceae bacterium]